MSTRATVHFRQGGKDRAIVYRHTDGYPEGLGKDLEDFLTEVKANVSDTRFGDPSYLAAKFVVWQAKRYANGNYLNFLSIGVVLDDPGDIEFRYALDCEGHERPEVRVVKC